MLLEQGGALGVDLHSSKNTGFWKCGSWDVSKELVSKFFTDIKQFVLNRKSLETKREKYFPWSAETECPWTRAIQFLVAESKLWLLHQKCTINTSKVRGLPVRKTTFVGSINMIARHSNHCRIRSVHLRFAAVFVSFLTIGEMLFLVTPASLLLDRAYVSHTSVWNSVHVVLNVFLK